MNRHEQIWNARWKGSGKRERVSWLGRRMFGAKAKALRAVLRRLQVRNMIEVGCGLGYTLSVYARAGIQATGIDISEPAVEFCRKKGLNVQRLALEDARGMYDLVSSDGMLEHFLDFIPHARQMMRLSGRYVLLIQPNHQSFAGKTLVYLSELVKGTANVYEYNYRVEDFIRVFEDGGFKAIINRPIAGDVYRLLVFEKS